MFKIETLRLMRFLIYFTILLSIGNLRECSAKILLFTFAYNRPDFIETQHETFSKFLKDEHELIVFNDARDPRLFDQIAITCERLGIRHIAIPQEIHNRPDFKCPVGEASKRNCNVVKYALDTIGYDHEDIVALLDADIFLVKEFSIREYMKGYDLAGHIRDNRPVDYLWIGLVFLDMARMPNKRTINFDCGWIDAERGVDAGGFTYFYLRDNPEAKVKYINELCLSHDACGVYPRKPYDKVHAESFESLRQRGYDPDMVYFIQSGPIDVELFLNGSFLHYAGACNWAGYPAAYHGKKTKKVYSYIESVLKKRQDETLKNASTVQIQCDADICYEESVPEPYRSAITLPYNPHSFFFGANPKNLERILKTRNPRVVVELGSWLGASTRFIASRLKPGSKLYAVDTWRGSAEHQEGREWSHMLPSLYTQFLSNTKHDQLTNVIVPIRMEITEAASFLNVNPDLIFRDASNHEQEVYNDIIAWYPKLNSGGIMCGDDYGISGVKKAIERILPVLGQKVHVDENFWSFDPK